MKTCFSCLMVLAGEHGRFITFSTIVSQPGPVFGAGGSGEVPSLLVAAEPQHAVAASRRLAIKLTETNESSMLA